MAASHSAEDRARPGHSHPWLAELLFAFDEPLRRRNSIFEYTDDPGCIFRLAIVRSRRRLALSDGARALPGQRIAQLHFWNEHLPPVPKNGATIAWGRQMQRAIADSLRELARHLAKRPELSDVAVICADVPSATRTQSEQVARIMARYGFESIAEPHTLPIGERLHRLGENILVSLVVFAQNAAALRIDTLRRVRVPIYLSRRTLVARFGASSESTAEMAAAS